MTPTDPNDYDDGLNCARGIRNGFLIELACGLLVMAALGCPRSAHAQSPQTVLTIASAADAASTVYALHANPRAREWNPALRMGGTPGLIAGKVVTTSALAWAIGKIAPTHPRLAKVIGYGGGAVLGGLAVNNVRLGGKR